MTGGALGCHSAGRRGAADRALASAMFERVRARELDPRGRLGPRGGFPSTSRGSARGSSSLARAPETALRAWAEGDALARCTATYSELRPAPRSTIAAAFSPDGKLIASTHGDHTVKLIDCRTGACLRTLTGHRRTPWVVRFHPTNPDVLASGSLDHEVRLWSAKTAECLVCFDFGKPIASLAFHAHGDVLAVASGHKLYTVRAARDHPPPATKGRGGPRTGHRKRPGRALIRAWIDAHGNHQC